MPAENYIQELVEEIEILDPSISMYTIQLLQEEINRVRDKAKRKKEKERYKIEEVVTVTKKIIVPVDKYPGHNFVGKLMGPKASTLKRIQAQTKSIILILGQGSTRDKLKEKLLRDSNELKYAHYQEPLHIIISVRGFKTEAEARLAAAVAEVNKYMDPNNEEVKQESLRILSSFLTPNTLEVNGVTPIIRVGVPPPGAIILSGTSRKGRHSTVSDPYKYNEFTYDGTYEGYPSTTASDALAFESISKPSKGYSKRTVLSDVDSELETAEKKAREYDSEDSS